MMKTKYHFDDHHRLISDSCFSSHGDFQNINNNNDDLLFACDDGDDDDDDDDILLELRRSNESSNHDRDGCGDSTTAASITSSYNIPERKKNKINAINETSITSSNKKNRLLMLASLFLPRLYFVRWKDAVVQQLEIYISIDYWSRVMMRRMMNSWRCWMNRKKNLNFAIKSRQRTIIISVLDVWHCLVEKTSSLRFMFLTMKGSMITKIMKTSFNIWYKK
jgi:hypothetical protein